MSDAGSTEGTNPIYMVGSVAVTPAGGGYYDLEAPGSGRDVERVRGKENADARAQALTVELTPPEGQMQAQPTIDQALSTAQKQAASTHVTISIEELDKLRAAAATASVTTVTATEGAAPPAFDPSSVPNQFTGTLDKKQINALGVPFSRIILEDNSDIPPTGLFISHNGRGYTIKPGEAVDVPDFLIEILDHAVMGLPVVDSKSQRVVGYRQRSKYPYRRVS